jgi:predicted CoA-binding protein
MELAKKKTAVLITSPKPDRYSNMAVKMLIEHKVPVTPIGYREEEVDGIKIIPGQPQLKGLHTMSIYLNPRNQEYFYNYILKLNPKRVIFNPGTENPILQDKLDSHNIFWEEACTLVLLSTGQF